LGRVDPVATESGNIIFLGGYDISSGNGHTKDEQKRNFDLGVKETNLKILFK